jgi:hypothetical protein
VAARRGAVVNDVYGELKSHAERYNKLLGLFHEFHNVGTPLLTDGPLRGIVIGEIVDDRYFDVALAGITARFSFTYQTGESRGRVTCYRHSTLKPEALDQVGHLEFNGQGDTGKKMPSGNNRDDLLSVRTDTDACYLIAELLLKAIEAPSAQLESSRP